MPSAATAEARGWIGPAASVVALVTLYRLVLLAFNATDLFVDESQYWLWGQRLDFGYYSKPPLIAWVIRLVTELAGSDAPFWVRMPGALFHAATAMILGALGARLWGGRSGFWVAIAYVTLPFVAVGSLLISTDTILAPFFAAALLFWVRALGERRLAFALAAGAMAGAACMAKYAGVYFLLGAVLAAVVARDWRAGWRYWALMLTGFAVVMAPNILWNLSHDLTTVEHTMDNVGWVREQSVFASLNPAGLLEFFSAQFAVFGPVFFAVLLGLVLRPGGSRGRGLLAFALPVLMIVCVQALMNKAYANWAVTSYFAGTVLVVGTLRAHPGWLRAGVAINVVIALILPLLTILPGLERNGKPLLARYLGRVALSEEIIALAQREGGLPVLAENRDVLADLFHTGADSGLRFYAPAPQGRAHNYYEQNFALPVQETGPLLLVREAAPVCNGVPLPPLEVLDTAKGAFANHPMNVYRIDAGCADALR